ncbi:MAG: hypothetical protein H0V81_09885 [Solirubrobacterales bacterium]|nr:hypothetical protein [Solirubrobacterales bacterium]
MRKLGLIAATAAASIGVTSFAQAIEVNQGLSVGIKGGKGTKAKPRNLVLSVTTTTDAIERDKNGTFATTNAVIHFDKNLRFNNARFPTCALKIVATKPEKCPKGSQVGTGLAKATVGEGQIKVNPSIKAYNDKNNKINLALIAKPGEVDSSGILVGKLKKDSGKDFGFKLDVPIPAKLQEQLGLKITLTKFNTTINRNTVTVKGKKYAYVNSIGCPKGGKYKFAGDFRYSDATKESVKTTAKC